MSRFFAWPHIISFG